MTIRRSATLAALAVALAAGCSGVRVRPGAPAGPPAADVADDPTPPIPEQVAPRPGPRDGVEGVYRLLAVGDSTLPAVVERRGGCEVRALQGTLSLQDGEFSFSGTTQEVCSGTARTPVVHRAEGRYDHDGPDVTFAATVGSRTGSARAQVIDPRTLQVVEVTAEGRTLAVDAEFRREEPRP